MPKKGQPRKWRGTDARQLIAALKKAGIKGEDIWYSADNHIQIRCPDGEELAEGRFVTFTGNPVPDLHQRYPHAVDVRPAEPPARGEKIA